MSITLPRNDIFAGVAFASQSFTLNERQELSRTTNGVTYAKSFGSALWTADWQTATMYHDDALDLEARLNSLDGAISLFYAGDLRRPFPKAHPAGDFTDDATIAALGSDGKSLQLAGINELTISRGDYLAFDYGGSRALHQAMETVTGGAMFEVRPHIRPGVTVGTAVKLKQPSGLFRLNPSSVQSSASNGLFSTVSFSAMQAL